jgi:hypothetical protein
VAVPGCRSVCCAPKPCHFRGSFTPTSAASVSLQAIAYTTFDRPIPLWATLCYPILFGVMAYVFYRVFETQRARVQFWKVVLLGFAINVVLEFSILATHIYMYYGKQPFKILNFPLYWLVLNNDASVLVATIAYHLRDYWRGPRWLLLILVFPSAQPYRPPPQSRCRTRGTSPPRYRRCRVATVDQVIAAASIALGDLRVRLPSHRDGAHAANTLLTSARSPMHAINTWAFGPLFTRAIAAGLPRSDVSVNATAERPQAVTTIPAARGNLEPDAMRRTVQNIVAPSSPC